MRDIKKIRFAEYAAIEAVNMSVLKVMRRSPAHCLEAMANARKETAILRNGIAAHTAVLEPARFTDEYAVFDGARRIGKDWKAFELEHAGKTLLKAAELEKAFAIRDAVRADKHAKRLLRNGDAEITMLWTDPTTGIDCKGRVDWFDVEGGRIVGLKTTSDGTSWTFSRIAARLGYHMQWAFYADGYEAIFGKRPEVYEIVAENARPYDVTVYRITEETLASGRAEYAPLLARFKTCVEADDWPGQAEGKVVDFTLPAWATGGAPQDVVLNINGQEVSL